MKETVDQGVLPSTLILAETIKILFFPFNSPLYIMAALMRMRKDAVAETPNMLDLRPDREFRKSQRRFRQAMDQQNLEVVHHELDSMEGSLKENPTVRGVVDFFTACDEAGKVMGGGFSERSVERTNRVLDAPYVRGELGQLTDELRGFRDTVVGGELGLEFNDLDFSLYHQEGGEGIRRKRETLDRSVGYVRENMPRLFREGVKAFDPDVDEQQLEQMEERIREVLAPEVTSFHLLSDEYATKTNGGKACRGDTLGSAVSVTASRMDEGPDVSRTLMHETFHRAFGDSLHDRPVLEEGLPELFTMLACSQDREMYPVNPKASYEFPTSTLYCCLKDRRFMSMDGVFRAVHENDVSALSGEFGGNFKRMFPSMDAENTKKMFSLGILGKTDPEWHHGLKPFQSFTGFVNRQGLEFDGLIAGAGEYGIFPHQKMAELHLAKGENGKAVAAADKNLALNQGNPTAVADRENIARRIQDGEVR